jgi:threonine dehydratase
MNAGIPNTQMLDQAQGVVAKHLRPTPIITWSSDHGDLMLKMETFQPSGSFKVRGALSAMAAYAGSDSALVTASAGNHALGMAEAARMLGKKATIVVPETASTAKIEALRRYPVDLRLVGLRFEDAEQEALRLAEGGMIYVSAYNDEQVIAGQSSVAAEVARQVDGPITLVVPVGGGGLIAGTALKAARHNDRIRVVGVETEASMAVSTAVRSGHTVEVEVSNTIADGLAGNIEDGCVTPTIVRDADVQLVSVPERSVRTAVRDLAAQAGIVAEGSSAVTLAAVAEGLVPRDRQIVLVLTGRNIAPSLLTELIA